MTSVNSYKPDDTHLYIIN